MIFCFFLTIFQQFFIIFLVLLQYLQSTGCHLNSPRVIFLMPRVDFVGHDLIAYGNCPTQSQFKLIQDWPLSLHGTYLLSFIGMRAFYNRYCPWFETNIKHLRRPLRSFHYALVPIMDQSPIHVFIFNICKTKLVFSPLLLRYDSSKLVFLKTHQSVNDTFKVQVRHFIPFCPNLAIDFCIIQIL